MEIILIQLAIMNTLGAARHMVYMLLTICMLHVTPYTIASHQHLDTEENILFVT